MERTDGKRQGAGSRGQGEVGSGQGAGSRGQGEVGSGQGAVGRGKFTKKRSFFVGGFQKPA